jgi:auxin influx carrier (AUX1 LAX family)
MNENNKLIYCLLVSLFGSEIMHAMWKPAKFKYIYLLATLYVFTLTLPSAAAMYWAFGDELLTHSNAFSLLPKTGWRDAAVILMLIHQFITFGFACTPLYFVWEKVIGMHDTKSIFKRALARLPIVVPIWFLAIIFPFFGPINSAVGALLVSFTVYIIPALAHILTYRTASARMVSALDPRPIHSFISYVHAGIGIRRFASLK